MFYHQYIFQFMILYGNGMEYLRQNLGFSLRDRINKIK